MIIRLTGGFLGVGFGVSTLFPGIHSVGTLPGTSERWPLAEN